MYIYIYIYNCACVCGCCSTFLFGIKHLSSHFVVSIRLNKSQYKYSMNVLIHNPHNITSRPVMVCTSV